MDYRAPAVDAPLLVVSTQVVALELRAQDWGAARASFETAWSLYPHPSILLNGQSLDVKTRITLTPKRGMEMMVAPRSPRAQA